MDACTPENAASSPRGVQCTGHSLPVCLWSFQASFFLQSGHATTLDHTYKRTCNKPMISITSNTSQILSRLFKKDRGTEPMMFTMGSLPSATLFQLPHVQLFALQILIVFVVIFTNRYTTPLKNNRFDLLDVCLDLVLILIAGLIDCID